MPPNTYWARWRFDDGLGDVYSFVVNPREAESPWWDNEYATEVTTGGTVLVTKSPAKPRDMSITGVVLDMVQYDAMVKWLQTRRRIYMWDHMDRRYEVVVKSFAPKVTAPTTQVHPGKHEYTLVVIVLAEPVVLP